VIVAANAMLEQDASIRTARTIERIFFIIIYLFKLSN
jgi:hypothetical protein